MKKRLCKSSMILIVMAGLCVNAALATEFNEVVLLDDPLNGKTLGRVDGAGEFVEGGGWRTKGGVLILDAGRVSEHGRFECTVRGMIFPSKGADKSSMFSGWEGDSIDPGKERGSFWHWRTGHSDVLKVLAAPDGAGTRLERGFNRSVYEKLNDGNPHRFGVNWENGRVEFTIDGEVLHTYRFHRAAFRYFSIGKERGGAGAQITDPSPIVSDVRVVDFPASEPADPAGTPQVAQRTVFEQSFEHGGDWRNPYREVTATVFFERFRGAGPARLPLFWDGGKTWRFRFAPNAPGRWTWRVESNDPGLNGKAGVMRCAPSTEPGGVVADGIEFKRETGAEFWVQGDLNWSAFAVNPATGLTRQSFERYLDVRKHQGFNLILADLLGVAKNEGGLAFEDYDDERINPAYWRQVEDRVKAMNARGLLALVALGRATPAKDHPGDRTLSNFQSDDALARYARHVIGRLGAYHTAFALAREWDGGDKDAQRVDALGRQLAALNPHGRILTVHTAANAPLAERLNKASWNGLAGFAQNYASLHAHAFNSRSVGRSKLHGGYGVYLLDRNNDGQPDFHNSASLAAARHAAWDIVMSQCVMVSAFAPTFDGGRGYARGFVFDDPDANEFIQQLNLMNKFFHSILPERNPRGGWHWLRTWDPVGDRAANDYLALPLPRTGDQISLAGVITPPERAAWKMAKSGFGYTAAVYVRGYHQPFKLGTYDVIYSEAESVDEPEAVYAIRLFNPRTGELTDVGTHRGREPMLLTPPSAEDWVFAVRRTNPYLPKNHTPDGVRRPAPVPRL